MAVRIGTGLSTAPEPLEAGRAAGEQAARELEGATADLAFLFASGAHLSAPEATLEGVQERLASGTLVGCGAGGVIGDRRELESGTAVAVWAATFDEGHPVPFHARVDMDAEPPELVGIPSDEQLRALIVLADPRSFPAEAFLAQMALESPGIPVLGGLASAASADGSGALMLDQDIVEDGAVGVGLAGIDLLPCVSQGAAPLGPELTITAAEGNVIEELAGRPALETLQRVVAQLSGREQALVAGGVLIGIVVEGNKAEYQQGDFLVRGIAGAEPASGRVVVATDVHEGQVIRLHARDARSAGEDLRRQLGLRAEALSETGAAGALLFSCNGRGAAMFGDCDHDALAVDEALAGAPTAGFFAAGEIGPVGGRSFLHGFTATLAVFPR